MTTEQTDFTQGSILKKLCWFMLPVLGALVLQAAYGAVDLLVVGRFGSTSGLSAVSTGSQVLNLVTFVVTQLAIGVTVLIARYLGEKRPEQIGSVIGGAAVIFTLLSAVLFVGLVGFARPISVLMQAPAEAVDLTASYVRICGGGIFFIVAYNLFSAIFRGLGDSKSPPAVRAGGLCCEHRGRPGPGGRVGDGRGSAAIATVLAQAVSVVLAVVLLKKHLPFTLRRTDFRLTPQCRKVLDVGLPLAYVMSIQPNASLTKIGMAAPVSTAVGNGDDGFAPGQFRNGLLDQVLVFRVHAGGGLVQDDDGASFKMAWAMEMRCFSPPEKLPPPSPTTVSYPLGRAMTKS